MVVEEVGRLSLPSGPRAEDMVRLVRPWPDHFSVNFNFLCIKTFIIIEWPDHLVFVIAKPDHLKSASSAPAVTLA